MTQIDAETKLGRKRLELREQPPGTKWCIRGEHFCPIEDMGRNRSTADGLSSWCLRCWRSYWRNRRAAARPDANLGWLVGMLLRPDLPVGALLPPEATGPELREALYRFSCWAREVDPEGCRKYMGFE